MTTSAKATLERLHEAVWQVLDDFRDGKNVCQAARDQLVDAYVAFFGDEGEDAPSAVILDRGKVRETY